VSLGAGTTLGAYEIVATIGAGGMGEVYRARDAKLGREVAIKVLTPAFAGDADRLKRFEQEARTAGALNHPNLVTVFELSITHTPPYIVMELVEGDTLRQRLAPSPAAGHGLPVRKAIDFASQIANGLAAAHDRGIVHRDLKPENIIVTPDGRLKILDFGLAKALGSSVSGASAGAESAKSSGRETMLSPVMTEAGTILGTVGYMAPEQVRGDAAVDHRADLFALGAILYEMLAGRRAFQAVSAVETMNAILRDDPVDLAGDSADTPAGLARVVQRCLEKSPAERFQSARDLGFHLGALGGDSGQRSGAAKAVAASRRAPHGIVMAAVGMASAVAGMAIGWYAARQPAMELARFETFTYSGSDSAPTASPDGRTIAFISARAGRAQVWIRQVDGGGERVLTAGPDDRAPRFSPDGASIIFVRSEDGRTALMRTALVGEQERRLLPGVVSADWSPDGTSIVVGSLNTEGATVVGIIRADGSDRRDVRTVADWRPSHVRWSPDGGSILAVMIPGGTTGARVEIFSTNGADLRILKAPSAATMTSAPVWTDQGREIVYATSSAGRVLSGLSRYAARVVAHDVTADTVRTLFWTIDAPGAVDIVATGTLAYDSPQSISNLRAVPLTNGSGSPESGTWLTRGSSIDRQPVQTRDGRSILFASTRSRNLDLWTLSRRDGALRRLTDDAASDWDPAYTPDGKGILWSSNRSGNFEIWMAAADGSAARQVTHDGVDAENPVMTPDGQWILHWSNNPTKRGVWKVRPDGTSATQLLARPVGAPEISPDGVYFALGDNTPGEQRHIGVYRVADGSRVPFNIVVEKNGSIDPNFGRLRWMPSGKAIAFSASGPDRLSGVFVQDFVPGQDTSATRRRLAGFSEGVATESFSIAADGKSIVLAQFELRSDILLAHGIPNLLPPVRGKR
jgi:Tol biopolymer transport system component